MRKHLSKLLALLLLVALTSCDARPKTEEIDRSASDPYEFCGQRFAAGAGLVTCHDPGVVSLSPLDGRTTIRTLDLRDTQVMDLSAVASLTNLLVLDLNRTRVVDLSPLAELPRLISIKLDGTQVVNVRPLASIPTLISLSLRDSWVVDIIPLVELKRLTHLDVTGAGVSLPQVLVVRHFLPGAQVLGP